ncbi:MAG: cbb3-type cytochrome c oxidase subunit 3 [Bacteroidales bacterium]|jgi:cbb3-type cytochrome oxidase subunit 3|nr:cbb3-type cytochrome c oxidase subunit 3 [Bacteroidales bacterium]MDD3700476.1 cbb3-type cytochrome c oxidase subunit 3 [Bacteroidales bacterium]MDY0369874.1 cbb3-type cytochrome c oxidase subunit 3 [Bacteroidales bacterium]
MKLVTSALESIADIQWFPIIGLIIFFSFFVILIIHVSRLGRKQEDEYSRLPLDEDDEQEYDYQNETKNLDHDNSNR